MRVRAPWLKSLGPVSHVSGGSSFNQISKTNPLVNIIGIFLGVYVYSSAAFAEVEEEPNQDEGKSSYSIITLSRGTTTTNLSVDGIINMDSQLEFPSSNDPDRFDEVLIPETVWSLDGSIGDHPGRVSGGFGSETHIFGGNLEHTGFWNNAIDDFRGDKEKYSLLPPSQFQVASCGGGSAEHSNLDYCTDRDKNSSNSVSNADTLHGDPSTSTTPDTDNTVISPNGASSSSPVTQSNFALVTPAIASIPLRQWDLTLQDPCDAAPLSCLTIPIDQPAIQFSSTTTAPGVLTVSFPPADSPTPPIGDLTPPIDPSPLEVLPPPISVDVPGLGFDSPPVFTPPPQKPIPEISTWAMTVIGFSIVVLVFGTKRKNRVNPISIVDISEGH
jgi:hypothetical protein